MTQMIFVNLPVKDLERTKGFFGKLGFSFNPQFSDETTACLVISDTIFAMLITEPRFKEFTKKEIADASKTTEAIIALSAESREEVDELADTALASGARPPTNPWTTGSCTAGRSRTPTTTSGRSCGWTRPQSRARAEPSGPGRSARPGPVRT